MNDCEYAIRCYCLLKDFISKKITAEEFEKKFLEWHDEFKNKYDEEFYLVMDDFFSDVDSYWRDCTPQNESDWFISEATLRKRAQSFLLRLKKYLLTHNEYVD